MKNSVNAPNIGRQAEDMAARFLVEAGYVIQERNKRLAGGELDIIAYDGPILAFVEVKAGAARSLEDCLAAIDANKRGRLAAAAEAYVAKHNINVACRFDVVWWLT